LGVALFFAYVLTFSKLKLGLCNFSGIKAELFDKLLLKLKDHGINIVKLNRQEGVIIVYGISRLIDMAAYKCYGNRIEFRISNTGSDEVTLAVYGTRTLSLFGSPSKDDWERYGFDDDTVRLILKELQN
jgi:hypothetical protein